MSAVAGADATVIVGVAKLIATVFAVLSVDRVGRRTIMVIGSLGCAASLSAVAASFELPSPYLAVVGCVADVTFWSPSFGAISLLLPSEIFPTAHRGRAMSIVLPLQQAACTLVSGTFLSIQDALGPGSSFTCLFVVCISAVLFVLVTMPETAGLQIRQIHAAFHARTI